MKVLIGVDGSPGAVAAVRMAARLLSPERDQVAFYFSVAYPPAGTAAAHRETLTAAREKLASEVFDAARAALPAGFHSHLQSFLGEEKPSQGILTTADAWQAELLVLGARGRSPLAQMLLGSTARRVAHGTHLPVLVVRSDEPTGDAMRLLFAFDDGPGHSSRAAAELLPRLTYPDEAEGMIASVVEPYHAGYFPEWLQSRAQDPAIEAMTKTWVHEFREACDERQQELVELSKRLPAVFQKLPPVVVQGHPADQILRLIKREQIDLVVLGAGDTGAFTRLVVGSVSDTVLTYADCSVLVVHKH